MASSVDYDEVHLRFVNLLLLYLLPTITHSFTLIITYLSGKLLISIAKKKKSVSLISALSKAFDIPMLIQMINHIFSKNLLRDKQSGFQYGKLQYYHAKPYNLHMIVMI